MSELSGAVSELSMDICPAMSGVRRGDGVRCCPVMSGSVRWVSGGVRPVRESHFRGLDMRHVQSGGFNFSMTIFYTPLQWGYNLGFALRLLAAGNVIVAVRQ